MSLKYKVDVLAELKNSGYNGAIYSGNEVDLTLNNTYFIDNSN